MVLNPTITIRFNTNNKHTSIDIYIYIYIRGRVRVNGTKVARVVDGENVATHENCHLPHVEM